MIEFGQAFEQNLTDSIDTSLTNSAAGFDRAFGERAQSIGEEIGTPLTDAVRGFRQAARDAAAAVDEPTVPTVKKEVAPVVRISSQDLKAIVSGTVEGESFRNSLRRGADPRLEGKDEAKATADNTERAADGIDELVAMQRDGGMGLASISV